MQNIEMIEISEYLLCSFEQNSSFNERNESLWNCRWSELLNNSIVKSIIENGLTFNEIDKDVTNSDSVLLCGVASLLAFVQENFTGPYIESSINEILYCQWPNKINASELLSVDGEELNPNVRKPELLYLSKVILDNLYEHFEYNFITQWWKIRSIMVHQNVLDGTTNTLYEKYKTLAEKLIATIDTLEDVKLISLLLLEMTQGYMLFRRVMIAEDILNQLTETLNIDLQIEGILGVRTKFQTKALPQLALKVKFTDANELPDTKETHGSTKLPTLLKLDDEVRLEKVEFVEKDENTIMQHSALVQGFILTKLQFTKMSQPKDKLADEELEPYLTSLIYQDYGPLPVRVHTLHMMVKQQLNHKRTVDRSLKQNEILVQVINETEMPVRDRMSFVFASGLIPRWSVEAQLADIMISLGMIKTALDIYLKLQLWEEVVSCYTTLDLRHKAADIIRQEIDKCPTVKLYCLLGDATDDVSCYETAWKFSNYRSGRAQRHWGIYYFAKKDYENAIPHLQKSLEINSLQEVVWLRLGYAALSLEKWDVAASAYRRYTNLEPHGFESWNNLAKAYVMQNDKNRAHKILHESLKCNFNNWRVWENFLFVSIDTGNFEDVINAYDRLIELKTKYYDRQVLDILANAIANDIPDASGIPSGRLLKKTQTLIGHVCVQQPNEGFVWELSAKLSKDEYLIRAQKLQKAYRAYTQLTATSWSKNPETCEKVVKLAIELGTISLNATKEFKDADKPSVLSQLSSARLSCQGCYRAGCDEKWPNCEMILLELKNILENLTNETKKLINK